MFDFLCRTESCAQHTSATRLRPVRLRNLGALLLLVNSLAAAQVPIADVVRIAAGEGHTCAIVDGGAIKCWGNNNHGQLGIGTTDSQPFAVDVVGAVSGYAEISAGWQHTCAATAAGAPKCWGDNVRGHLGVNNTQDAWTPIDAVQFGTDVAMFAAGQVHTCALTGGGIVKCGGSSDLGESGNSLPGSHSVAVVGGSGSGNVAVVAGYRHSCAITGGGAAICWGGNRNGELGDGGTDDPGRFEPEVVGGLGSGVAALDAGWQHTCAVTTTGAVKCWGDDADGQLGDGRSGSGERALLPVDVSGLGSGVVAVSAGYAHTCALAATGAVMCWGSNAQGQCGINDPTVARCTTPRPVVGLDDDVVAIAAGGFHTCALISDGTVKCWGDNDTGALGDGTGTDRHAPVVALMATTPDAPAISAVWDTIAGDVRISFTEPARNGGFPIQRYEVRDGAGNIVCSRSRPATWPQQGPYCDVIGLVFGTTYTFTVAAVNAVGTGTQSVPSDPFTHRYYPELHLTPVADHVYGDPPFTLVGTAGSIPLVFESQMPALCTTSGTNGTTLTIVGAGSCEVRGSVAGSTTNYPLETTFSIAIQRAPQILTVPATLPAVASGQATSFAVTGGGSGNPVTFTSQTPAHCSVQGLGTALATAIGAGTCVIQAAQDGDANHLAAEPRTASLIVENTAPTAADDAFTKTAGLSIVGNVSSNDVDPGNDALTASVDVEPMHGTLSLAQNGQFTYRPADAYAGPDSFAYTATDPFGATDSAIVTLDVAVPNAERIVVANGAPIAEIASLWSGDFAVATAGSHFYRLLPDLSVRHAISVGGTLEAVGLIADGTAFLAADTTFLYAFSPRGVSLDQWPRAVGSRVVQSMAATDAGTVFVCPQNGIVQVIDRQNRIQGSTPLGDDCAGAPLLLPDADAGVVVSIAGDGAVFSLSQFSGGELEIVRRFFLPSPVATPLSAVDGSTFVWIDQAGYVRKADADDPTYALASAGTVGLQPVGDVLTRDDGSIVFAGDVALHGRVCLYTAALAQAWCSALDAGVVESGVLGRPGEAYFGLANGQVVRIDLGSGDVTAAVQAADASAISSDLLFDGARVYVGDDSGAIARIPVTTFDALADRAVAKSMPPQGYWTGAMGGRMRNGRANAVQLAASMIFGASFE